MDCLSCYCWVFESSFYILTKMSSARNVIWTFFFWSSHSLNGTCSRLKVLTFDEVQLISFLVWIVSKSPLLTHAHEGFLSVIFSSFTVLHFTFRSAVHFEVWVEVLFLSYCMWTSSCFSTVVEKTILFLLNCFCNFFKN